MTGELATPVHVSTRLVCQSAAKIGTARGLYMNRYIPSPLSNPAYAAVETHPTTVCHLLGDIAYSIDHRPKGSGTRVITNFVESFLN